MYTALDIARYIINKCIELGRPVSNLQLQKILYYVQGEYIKINKGEVLFSDIMEAWQYGPVIPEVYYNYNMYSASEITDVQESMQLNSEVIDILDPVIEDKSKMSAWQLVEKTHSESPWKNAYVENNRCEITKEQMIKKFCN